MRRSRTIPVLALVSVLAIASCGSDDEADTTTAAPTAPAASTATTAGPAPETTAGGAAGTTGAPTTEGAAPGAPVSDVNVGVVLSASGAVAQIGQAGQRSLAAFEKCWTFKDGGKIHFEIINDGSDPTQAVAAVDTLVEKNVVALMGFSGSAFSAAFPRLLETKLPVVFIPPIPYPNFNKEPFIFSPNIPLVSNQLADFIEYSKLLGVKNLALLTTADAQGDAISKAGEALGLTAKQVPIDVTDFQPILTELKNDGVDGLVTSAPSGAPPAFVAISRQAMGWDVPQFLSPSNLTADFLKLAGDAGDGVRGFVWPVGIGSKAFETSNPEQAATIAEIEKCLPGEDYALNPTLGFYWDNALSIALAIDEAGSTEPEAIRSALENLTFYGAFGKNVRTPTDHGGYGTTNATFAILKDGKVIPAPDAKRAGT